jgi:hypothetical protein
MEGSLVAYKVFTNGSVLNASEINDNLMNQSVMVFSNSTARSAALTSPVEGMITYLEDTSAYESYDGTSWVGFGGGGSGILQVVSTAKTDTFTTASQTFTTVTGLTATITPSATSSKVLVTAQIAYCLADSVGNNGMGFFKVTRGGTDIYLGDAASNRVRTVFGGRNQIVGDLVLLSGFIQFLDSPSSTSALTYRVEARGVDSSSVFINVVSSDQDINNRPRGASSITVMEVAG